MTAVPRGRVFLNLADAGAAARVSGTVWRRPGLQCARRPNLREDSRRDRPDLSPDSGQIAPCKAARRNPHCGA